MGHARKVVQEYQGAVRGQLSAGGEKGRIRFDPIAVS